MYREKREFSLKRALMVLGILVVIAAGLAFWKHSSPQKVISNTNQEYTGEITEAVDTTGKTICTFYCTTTDDYVNFMNNEVGIEIIGASVRPHVNRSVVANSYTVVFVKNENAEKHEYFLTECKNEKQYKDFMKNHSIEQILDINVLVDSNLLNSGESYYVTYFE